MWNIETYDGTQDLSEWYAAADKKKFYNNSSPEMLLSFLETEDDARLFLLYYKDKVVGNVAAHRLSSLGILGKNAYRIAVRTCVLTHLIDNWKMEIKSYDNLLLWNNPTAQFLIPACINYVGRETPMYISTHTGGVGKQNAVHRIWTAMQVKMGVLKDPMELEYKGHIQTFWKLDVDKFEEVINANKWR